MLAKMTGANEERYTTKRYINIHIRARHVLMTFELWTLSARLGIFSLYISHLFLSSQQTSIAMWTILISKSWWWLLKPKCYRRFYIIIYSPIWIFGCPRGVMVKAMNCGIVVREFVLQSRYYVHFRANTLGKGMNPLILPPAMDK